MSTSRVEIFPPPTTTRRLHRDTICSSFSREGQSTVSELQSAGRQGIIIICKMNKNCCVCYEKVRSCLLDKCRLVICLKCLKKLRVKKCPLCIRKIKYVGLKLFDGSYERIKMNHFYRYKKGMKDATDERGSSTDNRAHSSWQSQRSRVPNYEFSSFQLDLWPSSPSSTTSSPIFKSNSVRLLSDDDDDDDNRTIVVSDSEHESDTTVLVIDLTD